MADGWQETLGELVNPLLAAANSATSLADFREMLEGELAQIEPGKLAEALARGQFAARVWGKLNGRTPQDRQTDGST